MLARQALEVAEASGAPSVLALARYATGEALADQDPDAALEALGGARRAAARVGARLFTGVATTAEVALRGRHGPPDEALRQYRSALGDWRATGAVGLALIALRNLVVLLARIGADLEAITLHASLERLQERDSFGTEARRLEQAVRAARSRLGPDEVARARQDAEAVQDLGAAATWALDVVDGRLEPGT